MLKSLISYLAPHYCLSCGEIGEQICRNCYFDIELSLRETCFMCHRILSHQQCMSCHLLQGTTQWVLAEREGVLERLIDEYKFSSARGTEAIIAQLLCDGTPLLPSDVCLVPVPTAPSHIRRRGFDHTRDITKRLARLKQVSVESVVARRSSSTQVGANRRERQQQAAQAYQLKRGSEIHQSRTYIICDDIVTTGATMSAMVELLRRAGATNIICLALLQQPWQD